MKKVKAGVIGVGYLGRFHAQKYAALENTELVWVVDASKEQADKVAEECGCVGYTDYKDILDQVDVVSIVVPTTYHCDVASDCLSAGLDVLLEKPMTVTIEEADKLNALAKEKDLILQIGHLERFNPAMLALKPFLEKPAFIESHRVAPFMKRATDVDVVLDLMIHDIEIILGLVKSPIKSVHCIGTAVATLTNDLVNARIIFENGATANITTSRLAFKTSRKMKIFQKNSIINVDFGAKETTVLKVTGELGQECMPAFEQSTHSFPESDALKSEIIAFVDHVENRTQPAVSGIEGREALAVALEVISQVEANNKLPAFQ